VGGRRGGGTYVLIHAQRLAHERFHWQGFVFDVIPEHQHSCEGGRGGGW
jgi:hypothetical protein